MSATTFDCCKGCGDRKPGCHDSCKSYLAARAQWDKMVATRNADRESRMYALNGKEKMIRAYISKRKHHMNTRARRR